MKRLIRKSNNDLDKIISDLSKFLSNGIDALSDRGELGNLIDKLLSINPSLESSGVFYRGLILNYNFFDFIQKMTKVYDIVSEAEGYLDTFTAEEVTEKQKEYKSTQIPSDVIKEIEEVCKSEIRLDNSYYSFAKTYDACLNFLFNAAPTVYDGDVYIIFKCDTSGLDIEKLNNSINDMDISEETKQEFLRAYKFFGYQKEVICRMTNIEIEQFQRLKLKENNSLYDLLIQCECDFYI